MPRRPWSTRPPSTPTGCRSTSNCRRTRAWPGWRPKRIWSSIKKAMGAVRLGVDAGQEKGRKARPPKFAPAGQSTQLIVGADSASDGAILKRSASLYGAYRLRRVYYSAFSPIPDSTARLPLARPPLVREHRLYQADWLMRFYGFERAEIIGEDEDLDLAIDPKLAWALKNRGQFPVDLNVADRERMLRAPGLGVRSVDRMIEVRRFKVAAARGRAAADAGDREAETVHRHRRLDAGSAHRQGRPARTRGAGAIGPLLMPTIRLASETDFPGWREAARTLRARRFPPTTRSGPWMAPATCSARRRRRPEGRLHGAQGLHGAGRHGGPA